MNGARCREKATEGNLCDEHQDADRFPMAARPTRILVKLNLPARLISDQVREICQKWTTLSLSVQSGGRAQVIGAAESVGRDAFIYRPGVPDSGSEVFCGDGAINTTPAELLQELYGAMDIGSVKLWGKKGQEGRFVLQVEFVSEARQNMPEGYGDLGADIDTLMQMTWGKTFIYCNIPKPDGMVLHTVNLTAPQDGASPRGALHFTGGDWAVTPVVSADA